MDELQAASAVGQGQLYQVYEELLAQRDVPSAQVLLTFFDMSARSHYVNARHTLSKLLDWRVVPVINENDTTTTDEISFGDNDFLAAQVAILLGAERLVLLTDTDGLYTADPAVDPAAEPVTDVHLVRAAGGAGHRLLGVAAGLGRHALEGRRGRDGHRRRHPGHDRPRHRRRRRCARRSPGEPAGTRFHPRGGRVSSFKLWLKYAKPVQGVISVDEGAARALTERGTSLLPVGIVGVAGDFDAGDAVEVRAAGDGDRPIGKGIVNYSSSELERARGLKSETVREMFGRPAEEAVHRDYFVLE